MLREFVLFSFVVFLFFGLVRITSNDVVYSCMSVLLGADLCDRRRSIIQSRLIDVGSSLSSGRFILVVR